MRTLSTFREIIELWPDLSAFAAAADVIYVTAQAMHRRDSIPSEYWTNIVADAERRGLTSVTLEALASIQASRRDSKRPSVEGANEGIAAEPRAA